MGKTIMAVDDSASIRQMVSFTLAGAGYQVVEATDGEDALSRLAGVGAVDLVITDVHMPRLDGIGLIKSLRGGGPAKFTPIVVLTTESQPAMKQAARDAGATAWITKPFKPDQLLAVVKKVIG